MKSNSKVIYITVLAILTLCLLLGYAPGMCIFPCGSHPPVTLFLGLAFALQVVTSIKLTRGL